MRIGCLQFAPLVGDVDNNLNRADSVLSKANPEDLDLLVLPELAFSGYNFKSLQDITPFLEPSGSGITSLWARTMALKYNCIVTVGYPEKVDVSPKWPTGPEYYNSAIVVNGDGETIANYRKSFLYYTDETWALEGNRGFYDGFIPGLGNVSIGICMDLNPYKFEAPWHAFEFAFHVLEMESNLVIVSMAWMTREDPRRFSRMPNEPDMETLTYWVTRLEPLIRSDNQDEIIVVFCNRTGHEDEATYAGTSAVIGIHDGEVKVYGLLGRGEKELLVVDTTNPPYAKLVYRPDSSGEGMEAPGELLSPNSDNSKDRFKSKPKDKDQSSPDLSSDKKSQNPSGGEGSKQTTVPPIPPLAPLPLNPKKEVASESPRKRYPPAITIPKEPDLVRTNSARSPGTESLNIPTPSAPSPTPMAIRPRLIIPESPPILPHQYPPDHPISAASLRSERSVQSVKSVESEASVQTVRSNPRPPEDSTPYPHSGAPLSGYPSNAFSEKRIYGGHVSIAPAEDTFSPDTPFDDMSPMSPQMFWRPSDSTLRTPSTAGGWTPGTPIGRRPEPFPWPAITAKVRPASRNSTAVRAKESWTPHDLRQMNSQSPQSNASSNRTNKTSKTNKTNKTESSVTSKGTVQAKSKQERNPARPSSPKSRNASRSRGNERSDSAFGERDVSAAISQHLEGISLRAESVNKMRSESTNGTPCPDRPQSPKSRNCSRSRPGEAELQQEHQIDHHMIHIAASPSILSNDGRNQYRPLSRSSHHQRSNSYSNLNGHLYNGHDFRSSTPTGSNVIRPASRAASRGRTPGPKHSPTNGIVQGGVPDSERASSTDSTRNDRLHSRVHTHPPSRQSRTRRTSSAQRMMGVSNEEFERVEAIVCPSCPVHGRNPSTNGTRDTDAAVPESHSSPRVNGFHSSTSPRSSPSTSPRNPNPSAQQEKAQRTETVNKKSPKVPSNGSPQIGASTDGVETSDYSSSETLQTISTPGRSPLTPSFNPDTPKAMVLFTDDTDVEPFPNQQLNGPEKTPTVARCVESDASHNANLPQSPGIQA